MLAERTEKMIKGIVESKSRKPFVYKQFRPGMIVNSYWDGGHRDYWYIINTFSGACKVIPQNGTPYDKLNLRCDTLATNEVLVCKTSSRGKELALVVYS